MAVSSLRQLNTCLNEPLTIVNLRAIMLLLTKAHYSDPANFGMFEEELGCLAIDPDKDDNDLTIGLDFIPSRKNPSPRPAVWVNFEGCELQKKAIDNKSGSSYDNSRTSYTKTEAVSFTVSHVHDSVDISLMMAETTSDFFSGIRPHLMQKLNIGLFEVDRIQKPKLVEHAPERYFQVDVVINMLFNFVMSANIESHRLKKFALDIQPE